MARSNGCSLNIRHSSTSTLVVTMRTVNLTELAEHATTHQGSWCLVRKSRAGDHLCPTRRRSKPGRHHRNKPTRGCYFCERRQLLYFCFRVLASQVGKPLPNGIRSS